MAADPAGAFDVVSGAARRLAHLLIRAYQLTLSSVVGRQCRHLPTCSSYMDEAITRHGLWIGGWMGAARLCRCHPCGTSGFDPVPRAPGAAGRWYRPWRYGHWRACHQPTAFEVGEDKVNTTFRSRSVEPR